MNNIQIKPNMAMLRDFPLILHLFKKKCNFQFIKTMIVGRVIVCSHLNIKSQWNRDSKLKLCEFIMRIQAATEARRIEPSENLCER